MTTFLIAPAVSYHSWECRHSKCPEEQFLALKWFIYADNRGKNYEHSEVIFTENAHYDATKRIHKDN